MSQQLIEKWDGRYAAAGVEDYAPAEVLTLNTHLLPAGGRALDLACGLGPQGLFLARQGLAVSAIDVSPLAVSRLNRYAHELGLPLQARAADLTREALPRGEFDIVVVVRFLERALCPAIAGALRPGGLLFYQTFTSERQGPGPSNPDFLLRPGELPGLFPALQPLYFREDRRVGDAARGLRGEALLVAQAAPA